MPNDGKGERSQAKTKAINSIPLASTAEGA
jgi:hypothetical protein